MFTAVLFKELGSPGASEAQTAAATAAGGARCGCEGF